MPSLEHEQLVSMISEGLALEALPLDEQRAAMEASAEFFPPDPDVLVDAIDAGGVPAEWISVTGSEPSRTVLYLHGGAYVMGSPKSHRGLAGRMARAAGARVLVVD